MRRFFATAFLLVPLVLAAACATLPRLDPAPPGRAAALARSCDALFPVGKWRLIHTIRATLRGDRQSVMTGVAVIDSDARSIHSVMMTVEGLVVLDAVYADGRLTLNRGVPPFDSKSFARGMMADIRLIFFKPEGKPETVGTTEEGKPACRYDAGPDRTIFIAVDPETGDWTLRRYRGRRLARTVKAEAGEDSTAGAGAPVPKRLTLTAHGFHRPYTLTMTLQKGERIPGDNE